VPLSFTVTAAPAPTYTLTVVGGTDTTNAGPYAAGAQVSIAANAPEDGQVFDKWIISGGGGAFGDENDSSTTFTMPASDAAVTAEYKEAEPVDPPPAGPPPVIPPPGGTVRTYALTVVNGSGSGRYSAGEKVTVAAYDTPKADDGEDIFAGFTDVYPLDWFYGDVKYATVNGLIKGVDATRFSPRTVITRGMLATILGRMTEGDFDKWTGGGGAFADAGANETVFTMPASDATVTAVYKSLGDHYSGYPGFDDVDPQGYYAPYIAWAKDAGVVHGITASEFQPDRGITREELAHMLVSYINVMGVTLPEGGTATEFTDAGDISAWARSSVERLAQARIILGDDNRAFNPRDGATRAEAAALLRRVIERAAAQGTR
jgi:hypothetical protein